jgi:hypothetical protein
MGALNPCLARLFNSFVALDPDYEMLGQRVPFLDFTSKVINSEGCTCHAASKAGFFLFLWMT